MLVEQSIPQGHFEAAKAGGGIGATAPTAATGPAALVPTGRAERTLNTVAGSDLLNLLQPE
jgi:hypothetical protein